MLKIQKLAFLPLVFSAVSLWAQATPEEAPPAPVPVQISTGRKVFISNAQGESAEVTAIPNQTYNEFYAAMKDWGRYELVSTPTDANERKNFKQSLAKLVDEVKVLAGK